MNSQILFFCFEIHRLFELVELREKALEKPLELEQAFFIEVKINFLSHFNWSLIWTRGSQPFMPRGTLGQL